jgi:hypothetical protein
MPSKPPAQEHLYNNPDITTGTEFLLAVMHDASVPLATRVDVAARLLKLMPPEMHASVPPAQESGIKIVIPPLPPEELAKHEPKTRLSILKAMDIK